MTVSGGPGRWLFGDPRLVGAGVGVALLAGVGAGLAPMPTVAVVGAGLLVAMVVFTPRLAAGAAVLVILFVRPLEHLVAGSAVSDVGNAVVLGCVLGLPLHRLAARKPLRTFPGQWWFAMFLILGVLSGLVAEVPPLIFLAGAYVIGKGLLLAWAVAQLEWSERHLLVAVRVSAVVIVFSLVATAANLVMLSAWNAWLASDLDAVEPRGVLPSLIGPFSHPIDLGQFMTVAAVAIAAWRATARRGVFSLVLLIGTVAGAVLTARRTAAASLISAWLAVQAMVRSTRVLVVVLAGLPLMVVLAVGPVTEVVRATYQDYIGKGTPEARTVLTVDSVAVAAQHFPLGAGFGRFASAVAAANYSPEYLARGYPSIWGLGPTEEDGRFLTDTEWPAIVGESGFFGAAAYLVGLVGIGRAGRRLSRLAGSPMRRWAGLTMVGWLVALSVESVGTVSFTGPPVSGAFFALVGVVTALAQGDDRGVDQAGGEATGAVEGGVAARA